MRFFFLKVVQEMTKQEIFTQIYFEVKALKLAVCRAEFFGLKNSQSEK